MYKGENKGACETSFYFIWSVTVVGNPPCAVGDKFLPLMASFTPLWAYLCSIVTFIGHLTN